MIAQVNAELLSALRDFEQLIVRDSELGMHLHVAPISIEAAACVRAAIANAERAQPEADEPFDLQATDDVEDDGS